MPATASDSQPNGPQMIKVFDQFGREMLITREEWKEKVLFANLDKVRDDPDGLYGLLVMALQDGFGADIVPYAEHLGKTDPVPSRGAAILGIVYMAVDRLDDAERALSDCLSKHGDDGVVLTNLAKVHASRGDHDQAETILWRGLTVDPNQDNGLSWLGAMHHERGGDAAMHDAFRRVAALPESWRAQLWLAQNALQADDWSSAETLYAEALSRAGQPTPSDLLMQMSGDLGNAGRVADIIELVAPSFDPQFHGLEVGNNLIKANLELGQLDDARQILDQLYAQNRPDWKEVLGHWDGELAQANVDQKAGGPPGPTSISLMAIEGPLWTRAGSPFAELMAAKPDQAPRIAIIGSSALQDDAPELPVTQLADGPGRLSRAAPLALAERIHLTTNATGVALIAWAQGQGFALLGHQGETQELCQLASNDSQPPDFVAGVTVDTRQARPRILLRLAKVADGTCVAEEEVELDPETPGDAVNRLAERLVELLTDQAGIRAAAAPSWYQLPDGPDGSDYLLRLEQLLAVTCMTMDFLQGGGLHGEREILDGSLQLCLRNPRNPLTRMAFAQTLRLLRQGQPEVVSEFARKVALLQSEHPLTEEAGEVIAASIAGTLGNAAQVAIK